MIHTVPRLLKLQVDIVEAFCFWNPLSCPAAGSELVQKYVGEGARMVRELFQMARSKKACIIFFDEVGAVWGRKRATPNLFSRMVSHPSASIHRPPPPAPVWVA